MGKLTAEYNEEEEVITGSSINKIRTRGRHRGHVPLPSLPKKGNRNARSRYSNRTVTTNNATFIVILVFVLQVKKAQGACKAKLFQSLMARTVKKVDLTLDVA